MPIAAIKGSHDLNDEIYPASGILFENGTVGKHIDKVVHWVAPDERRVMF